MRRARSRFWRLAMQRYATVWLTAMTIACGVLIYLAPSFWPVTILVLPMVAGSLLIDPRSLPWFVVFVMSVLALLVPRQPQLSPRTVIAIITLFVLGFFILMSSFRRSRLGVAGVTGESMLVDLRDRIQSQGTLPVLPEGWYAESALRSAGGTPFAGDFVVASRTGDRLDLAVVDVSGKGAQAGARSLLLSGAFGGLIAGLGPAEFLPAANDYLLRQGWDEGFATAIHLSLDLATGKFELRTAGHPPGVQLMAGSGKWVVHETEGPLLGIFEDAHFDCAHGSLKSGDAMLLYTDGLVETPDRDIFLGIDRLVGQSERMLRQSFDNGAKRLIERLGSTNDDRALLLIHRR